MLRSDHSGYVIYDGPARFTRERIVVIATGYKTKSSNPKTGPMIQTWILTADQHPAEAARTGEDVSICGDCAFRPLTAKDTGGPRCYVNTGVMGPSTVWKTWTRGLYPALTPAQAGAKAHALGRSIRLGAYGDPAMAPIGVWRDLTRFGKFSGYTHQWKRASFLRDLCMASVNNEAELEQAHAQGWRTFRVVKSIGELKEREISCPASNEAGHRTTCDRCLLCNGTSDGDRRASIAIIDHGPTSPRKLVRNLLAGQKSP
jgi:hypothetical protein